MNLITNKKNIIAFLTVVSLLLIPCDIPAKEAYTGSDFKLTGTSDFETFDAKVYVYEHIATGANVVFIDNDDPNKYFMLEFDTPTLDNRGLPHVFEHSAMCGSKKYPSRSLTRALYNRSYITYGNALTRDKCTVFPIASLSEEQLRRFADYYCDLCFEPLIMTDEDIFRSEAWRLSLEDEDDEIKVAGTIYSEMTGEYTADRAAIRSAIGLLYPGSASSFESGGIPSEILKLTYQDVRSFHDRYYHPSNCSAYLYGDIQDIQYFLDLLDGYFDAYEKKDIDVATGERRTEEGFVGRKYDFPAAAGTSSEGSTEMVYAVDLGGLTDEQLRQLYAFIACCNVDTGTAMMILRGEFPGARFSFNIEQDQNGSLLYVTAGGMNEDDAEYLHELLGKIFAMIADQGLDEKELEYFRRQAQAGAALAREGRTAALSLLSNISNLNSCGRGSLFYMEMRDGMHDMKWFDNDLVKEIASKYLADPKRSAMSVVVQKAGLAEENEANLTKMLSDKKKSMTGENIKKLISDTKRITEKATDDPSKYLDELSIVNVSNLPEVKSEHTTVDKTDERGTRKIWVSTDAGDMNSTSLYLDVSSLPQDKLKYLMLFADLVNGHFVPTGRHSSEELFDILNTCTYRGEDISVDVSSNGNDFTPYVVVSFMCDPASQQEAFDITHEMLFDSVFTDSEKIKEAAASIKKTIRSNIERNPENLIRFLGYAREGQGAAYYEHTHYLEYYDFLSGIEKMDEKELNKVMSELSGIGKELDSTGGAVLGYAVSPQNRADYEKCAEGFTGRLSDPDREKSTYSFKQYGYPLAVKINRKNVYNGIFNGDVVSSGMKDDPSSELALDLITNEYVKTNARDRYGAYQCSYMNEYPSMAVITGNDPTIAQTFETFEEMGDEWKDLRKSGRKALSEYIITLHSQIMVSNGDINDANAIIAGMVCGKSACDRQIRALAIRKITPASLERCDAFFDDLSKNGAKVTIGSPDMIEKNKNAYKQILDPFGAR